MDCGSEQRNLGPITSSGAGIMGASIAYHLAQRLEVGERLLKNAETYVENLRFSPAWL
jgi:hypothetical protein